jgi:hypothetical protein
MYQIVHASAGMLIGSQTGNPWLAFVLGFVSHYILDAIPHDAIELRRWRHRNNYIKKVALEATYDLWLFVIIVWILQQNNLLSFNLPILAGIIGAILPDYILGVIELFGIKSKWAEKYKAFHKWVHHLIYKPAYLPIKYIIPIQLSFLIIFLCLFLLL